MDDLKVSSHTFEEHVVDCRSVFAEARKGGLEFKARKGQYNQKEIVFWGKVVGEFGVRAEPNKLD